MSMYPIASVGPAGSGGIGTITFSSIPQNFTHLQIRVFCRTNGAATQLPIFITFNGDSGSNYNGGSIQGGYNSPTGGYATSTTPYGIYCFPGSTSGTNYFGVGIIDIYDYTNASINKTFRATAGYSNYAAGGDEVRITEGSWMNTSAITSITLSPYGGSTQYSQFDLYGIVTA